MRRFLNFFLASLAGVGWFFLYQHNVRGYSYTAFGPSENFLQHFHLLQNLYLAVGGIVALWWLWGLVRAFVLPSIKQHDPSPAKAAAGEENKRLVQRG